MPTVPFAPCAVPWCQGNHPGSPGTHTGNLDSFQVADATVTAALRQEADAPAVVRVLVEVQGRARHLDVAVETAAALGHIITALGTPTVFDFAAALTRAATLRAQGHA